MSTHGEACIQKQDAAVGPRCKEPALIWRREEGGIVVLERFVDVGEGGWSWSGWTDREGEAVGLVDIMVWILTYDHCFDCVEGCVSGPELSHISIRNDQLVWWK